MLTLLNDQFAPITSSIGFLRAPLGDVAAELVAWRTALGRRVDNVQVVGTLPELLTKLEPLTGRGRVLRELLIGTEGDWVAYFNSAVQGGDPVSAVSHLSGVIKCYGIAITSVPHTWKTGAEVPGRMGGVKLELYGPDKTDFLNYLRTISLIYDGSRWTFDASGSPQDFEDVERYASRRIRDRFTSEMLAEYCHSLGIEPFSERFYSRGAILIEDATPIPPDCLFSIADAQNRQGIVPGIAGRING